MANRRLRQVQEQLPNGFTVEQGGKHLKVRDPDGNFVTTLAVSPSASGEKVEQARVRRLHAVTTEGGTTTVKRWTHEASVAAVKAWGDTHGRAPRQHELGRRASPPLPSAYQMQPFGGLRALVLAAGLDPAPQGRRTPGQAAIEEATNGAQPIEPIEEEVNHTDEEGPTPLEVLVQQLKQAERVLDELRAPYVKARDDVQLLRMEIVELLQTANADEGGAA